MPSSAANQILHGLRADELRALEPYLQQVLVPQGHVLSEAGQPAKYLFFPITCVLSVVGTTEAGATVEVAVVGREGLASVSAALGRRRIPFRIVAQIEGTAWQVGTETLTAQLGQCRELHQRILRYSHSVIAQVGQSAICNRFHTARQRLARWLLMTADRVESRDLPLTHEFIAHMVGGPRSAVTEAAAALRELGAIDYRRGVISIRNLAALREVACECYDAVEHNGNGHEHRGG